MSILDHTFPPNLKDIYTEELANQLANTQGAIASLNQLDRLLHNPNLLMHPILGKEAESSSQLEGTQASIEDAYKIDIMDQAEEENEAVEIRNYERAMYAGLAILEKMPLDKFAIREVHKTLLSGARGKEKHPGEFRKGDAWIGQKGTKKGESRYVAPDAAQVDPLVEQLVDYIQNPGKTHPLLVCGVLHHRFEAIHPFEDGNGRSGSVDLLYLIKKIFSNCQFLSVDI
jgi:Fic family protein